MLQISGKILYNGHSFDEFVPERSAAYISQVGALQPRPARLPGARCVAGAGQVAGFQACASNRLAQLAPSAHPRAHPCTQVDLHYGELTVRETFEFAAECQSRSYARGAPPWLLRSGWAAGRGAGWTGWKCARAFVRNCPALLLTQPWCTLPSHPIPSHPSLPPPTLLQSCCLSCTSARRGWALWPTPTWTLS